MGKEVRIDIGKYKRESDEMKIRMQVEKIKLAEMSHEHQALQLANHYL